MAAKLSLRPHDKPAAQALLECLLTVDAELDLSHWKPAGCARAVRAQPISPEHSPAPAHGKDLAPGREISRRPDDSSGPGQSSIQGGPCRS
jgi:hypothetical protein